MDDAFLISTFWPAYVAAGQQVTDDLSNQFRHYALNTYYPYWPNTSSLSFTAEETWMTASGSTYWLPLAITSQGSSIQAMTVVTGSLSDNYFVATSSAGLVNVALPPLLQRKSYDGLMTVMPDGPHIYAYVSPGKRTDNGSDSEIWPPYPVSGSQLVSGSSTAATASNFARIYATQPNGGTGVASASLWQEISSERFWKVQVVYCSSSITTYVPVDGPPSLTSY